MGGFDGDVVSGFDVGGGSGFSMDGLLAGGFAGADTDVDVYAVFGIFAGDAVGGFAYIFDVFGNFVAVEGFKAVVLGLFGMTGVLGELFSGSDEFSA